MLTHRTVTEFGRSVIARIILLQTCFNYNMCFVSAADFRRSEGLTIILDRLDNGTRTMPMATSIL